MVLVFNKYRQETSQYNCYKKEHLFEALTLGLAEELLEFSAASTLQDKIKELGDILWYCAEFKNGYFKGKQEHDLACRPFNVENIQFHIKYLISVVKKGVYRGDYSMTDCYTWVHLFVDSFLEWFEREHTVLIKSVVMDENLKKLADRANRFTIKGEGDNR